MIRFHADAEAEVLEAERYYSEIQADLAKAFRHEIETAMDRIQEGPERWPQGGADSRRYTLRRFPYAVVYLLDDVGVLVVAVAHGKRRPSYWKVRVAKGI